MFQLLKGVRIIDLTTVALGPYATQILGDFGADVIKVESKDGDVLRPARPGRREDLSASFLNFNRNKRSVILDLKTGAGQSKLHELVAKADVVVHNMRTRSAEQLGASYDVLKQVNPKLVYCCSPGFGSRGPDANAPAYDDIIQARCGLAALNADADGEPNFIRTILCDKVVGLHLALAVSLGLAQQSREGKGVNIEVPMLETMVSFVMAEHLAGHTLIPEEGGLGYDRLMNPNRRPFQTRDGFLAILPYTTRHWIRFFEICGLPEWTTADEVIDPGVRSQNIEMLYGLIAEEAEKRDTDWWIAELNARDIPCARVNSLADLFTDEQLVASGIFHQVTDARIGDIRQIRSPFQVDGLLAHEAGHELPAPGLGEHSSEILG